MHPSTRDGIYIRALQQMLLDIGLITASHVTGHFDGETERVIKQQQKLNALTPAKYGTVEKLTWNQIIDRGCVGLRLLSAARSEPARTAIRRQVEERRLGPSLRGTSDASRDPVRDLDQVLDVGLALLEQLEDARGAGGGVDG